MLQSVCGKVKLALNQQYTNNTQNQTPVVAHFFGQKGTGSRYSVVHHTRSQLIESFDLLIILRN